MLVLSRKPSQTIRMLFGKVAVVVHILKCGRGRTVLGFEGPPEAVVLRGELAAPPPGNHGPGPTVSSAAPPPTTPQQCQRQCRCQETP